MSQIELPGCLRSDVNSPAVTLATISGHKKSNGVVYFVETISVYTFVGNTILVIISYIQFLFSRTISVYQKNMLNIRFQVLMFAFPRNLILFPLALVYYGPVHVSIYLYCRSNRSGVDYRLGVVRNVCHVQDHILWHHERMDSNRLNQALNPLSSPMYSFCKCQCMYTCKGAFQCGLKFLFTMDQQRCRLKEKSARLV